MPGNPAPARTADGDIASQFAAILQRRGEDTRLQPLLKTRGEAGHHPRAGEVLVKTLYLSLDPTQRTWINDSRNYMEPVKIGDVMRGSGLGVVVEAGPGTRLQAGDLVDGMLCTLWRV